MTGKELIELIKNKKLENEEIFLFNGITDSGELILSSIKDIKKTDEWNGNRNYIEEK